MPAKVTDSIPRTVDPNYTITNAEQAMALDKAFDDAFGKLGAESSPPPPVTPAPKTELERPVEESKPAPPVETKPAEPESKPPPAETKPAEPETKAPEPETKAPAVHPDEEPDPELDAIRLHPDSRPETVQEFRNLRGLVKTERKVTKELREKVQAQERELQTSRSQVRPVNDPTVQKELEDLRTFRQKHQIFDDSTFQTQYEMPVRNLFDEILRDVKGMATDQAAGEQWEKEMRALGPDKLDRAYWSEGVVNQCQDPLMRDRLTRKINSMLEVQEKRNEFRDKMLTEPNAYEQWQAEQVATYWKQFGDEATDEVKKLLPQMGEWASEKDLALAKTTEERSAWEAHNKTFKEYENIFQNLLTDAATQGARGMTRVAAQATLAERYKRDLASTASQLEKARAELKEARDELNKIANARSRATSTSGGTAVGAKPTGTRRASQSADEAFKEFFGNT